MFKRGIEIAETRDFSDFHVPMLPIPERVEAAIAKGVQHGPDLSFASAHRLIEPEGDGVIDGVIRNRDGVLVVCCQTDMPGVSPEMWDWWFGWHGLSIERYRLWHPRDHVWSAMTENRAHLSDARSRYIGNTSLIEERMGGTEITAYPSLSNRRASLAWTNRSLRRLGRLSAPAVATARNSSRAHI